MLRAPKRLDVAARELDEYFGGRRRVLRAEGRPGGYIGGPGVKQALLRLEAAA